MFEEHPIIVAINLCFVAKTKHVSLYRDLFIYYTATVGCMPRVETKVFTNLNRGYPCYAVRPRASENPVRPINGIPNGTNSLKGVCTKHMKCQQRLLYLIRGIGNIEKYLPGFAL